MPDRADWTLVPLAEQHVPLLAALTADEEAVRFTRIPEPVPEGFAANWVKRYEDGRRTGTQFGFAICAPGDGEAVGVALVPAFDREGAEAELGYLVDPRARGRGAATAGLRLLTEWVFAELGVQRAYLIIDAENPASQTVARRAGYTYEGTMRSTHLKQGRRLDAQLWSRLPGDPPVGGG